MAQGFQHRAVAKRSRNFAKTMRRSATGAESAMWRLLRHRRLVGFKFRRQIPIEGFIVDDERRDLVLAREGFRVLRYWNNDVLQRPTSVLEDLFAHLTDGKD